MLSAAVQQDVAATRTALLMYLPCFCDPMDNFITVMTSVLLGMWLAAAADQAQLRE
jgi:hypothetical protein